MSETKKQKINACHRLAVSVVVAVPLMKGSLTGAHGLLAVAGVACVAVARSASGTLGGRIHVSAGRIGVAGIGGTSVNI